MTQEQKASTEQVSNETVSSGETTQKTETKVEPLTEERIQQLIAEATQKAIEQGKVLGKREMQSIKDREVAEVQRKAELAESRAKAYETNLTDLDEETRAKLEAGKKNGELDYYKTRIQEEESRKQQEAYYEKLNQSLKDEVSVLGIDPSDSRIDYATDAPDYFEGRKRFSASLAKIVKQDKEKTSQDVMKQAEERFKKLEADFRKEHGLDSQDTTTSKGVVDQSDADFMAAWGDYRILDSAKNRERYEAIKKKYY